MPGYDPKDLQRDVQYGFQRMHNFRQARMMFMRAFLGNYYNKSSGKIGNQPMNLIFNAIRVLLPQIVMSNPRYTVESEFVMYKEYAELLQLGLNYNTKKLKLAKTYRLWLMDAILGGLGIMKTGLADSDSAITFDDQNDIDPGMIYSDHVDFDNFVFDPTNKGQIGESQWMGDRIRVKRSYLMDSGLYDNALIESLPKVDTTTIRAEDIGGSPTTHKAYMLKDYVEIVELWVPSERSIITVPAPYGNSQSSGQMLEKYLRQEDAYGPADGPYTFLSITPPCPANPMAIAPVGIWYDLHVMANRIIKKAIDQADRQKDIIVYRRSAADDAQEALDAPDGHAIGIDDPEGIQSISFGGQKTENIEMSQHLQMWFNTMAANPQGIGGQTLDSDSATEANILQANADVSLTDTRDLVYQAAAEEGSKRAFYLHTDPMIDMVLARRKTRMTESGPQPYMEQVSLTPEVRQGEFIDFHFSVEPESMTRMDTQTRIQRSMDFVGRILPSIAQTAMMYMQMGQPLNLMTLTERMAKEANIEWFDEVWFDPTFQQRFAMYLAQSPGQGGEPGDSKGTVSGGNGPNQPVPGALAASPSAQTEFYQQAQQGAVPGQQDMGNGGQF